MSRRRHRHLKTKAAAALSCAAGLWWAWQHHPVALTTAASAALVIWLFRLQHRLAARRPKQPVTDLDLRPTDLYFHYFHTGRILYIGIAVDYNRRCREHEQDPDDWWWYFVDPTQSVKQTWLTRPLAEAAETAAIRAWQPIGNCRDNPAWARQQPERAVLRAEAVAHRIYAQPAPVITGDWAPRPRNRPRRQRAYGGAR